MSPLITPVIGGLVESVGKITDDLFTSDEERAKAVLDGYVAETARIQGQMDINKIEAANPNAFVSGWRPAFGWVGVAAMAYQFVIYPFLTWGWAVMQAAGWVSPTLLPPPLLDTEALWVILTGILGLGVYRTTEKIKGVTR